MTEKLILGDLSAGKFENIDRFILVFTKFRTLYKSNIKIWRCILDIVLCSIFFLFLRIQNYLAFILYISKFFRNISRLQRRLQTVPQSSFLASLLQLCKFYSLLWFTFLPVVRTDQRYSLPSIYVTLFMSSITIY